MKERMMILQRFRILLAVGFSILWLLILLGGADFPPPSGFVWVVFLDLVAGLLVYVRVPTYIRWIKIKKRYRFLRACAEGLLVGLVFALIPLLVGSGEPSVTPSWIDRVIWFMVVGLVGVVNAIGIYACCAWRSKRLPEVEK